MTSFILVPAQSNWAGESADRGWGRGGGGRKEGGLLGHRGSAEGVVLHPHPTVLHQQRSAPTLPFLPPAHANRWESAVGMAAKRHVLGGGLLNERHHRGLSTVGGSPLEILQCGKPTIRERHFTIKGCWPILPASLKCSSRSQGRARMVCSMKSAASVERGGFVGFGVSGGGWNSTLISKFFSLFNPITH